MLLYVRFGRRILYRAYDGMVALAHTPVLPEATRVGRAIRLKRDLVRLKRILRL